MSYLGINVAFELQIQTAWVQILALYAQEIYIAFPCPICERGGNNNSACSILVLLRGVVGRIICL